MHSEFSYPDTVRETEQMEPSDSAVPPREHALEAAIDDFIEIKNVQLYSAATSCSASPSRSQTAVSSVRGFRPRDDR